MPAPDNTNDEFDKLAAAEEAGLNPTAGDGDIQSREGLGAGFTNNFTSAATAVVTGKKSKSPLYMIIGLLLGMAGISFGGFVFNPLMNLKELAVANLDTQNTILSRRQTAVVNSIIGDTTTGSCNVVQIRCRYARPSNAFLAALEKNGITPVNAAGEKIDSKKIGFNEKPAKYIFIDKAGVTHEISPKDFVSRMRTDPEFRAAFSKTYNTRYWAYTDKVARSFMSKLGLNKTTAKLTGVTDDTISENLNAITDDIDGSSSISEAPDKLTAAQDLITDEIQDEVGKSVKKAAKSPDVIVISGIIGCAAINAPAFVTNVVRVYQMRQVIALAAGLVLTPADAMKAGKIDPAIQSAVLGSLTNSYTASDGTSVKSAMDSDGIKNIILNESSSSSDAYKKMIPGGALMTSLGGFVGATSNKETKKACELIAGPAGMTASIAIQTAAAAASGGTSAAVSVATRLVLETLVALGAAELLMSAAENTELIRLLVDAMPVEAFMNAMVGDYTENIKGEDLGNGTAAGLNYFFSQSATDAGAVPMTINQVVAFDSAMKETEIAYAEQERATRSPLDISSRYTFLGSIFADLSTYIGMSSSPILSAFSHIASQPLSFLLPKTYAAESTAATRCGFASNFGADESIGVGMFGNLCTGIPVEYLDQDAMTVYDSVSSMVDPNTGQPLEDSELSIALADCRDGSVYNAYGCAITDDLGDEAAQLKRANMAVYMYDLRIVDVLSGNDGDENAYTPAIAEGTDIDTSTLYQDSSNIPCDPRTTTVGVQDGYRSKNLVKINTCRVTYGTNSVVVNSRVSTAFVNMITEMQEANVAFGFTSGFRDMATQQSLYNAYKSGKGNPAAEPGTSNHQMGLAVDFKFYTSSGAGISNSTSSCTSSSQCAPKQESSAYNWLTQNASRHGYSGISNEFWHWEVK